MPEEIPPTIRGPKRIKTDDMPSIMDGLKSSENVPMSPKPVERSSLMLQYAVLRRMYELIADEEVSIEQSDFLAKWSTEGGPASVYHDKIKTQGGMVDLRDQDAVDAVIREVLDHLPSDKIADVEMRSALTVVRKKLEVPETSEPNENT